MKIAKQKNKKSLKKIILLSAGGVVLLGLLLLVLELTHVTDLYKKPGQQSPVTETQKNDPNTGKDKTSLPDDTSTQQPTDTTAPKPSNPGSTTPPQAANLSITIIRAGQIGAGQPVAVRAFVGGAQSGTCRYSFTMAGQTTLTKTVATRIDPTYVSCEPLDIASAEFSASGNWQIEAVFNTGGKDSSAVKQTVMVTK